MHACKIYIPTCVQLYIIMYKASPTCVEVRTYAHKTSTVYYYTYACA